jgi:hypothetical protein
MNPFLSTFSLKELHETTTLLCLEEGSTVLCSIPNSLQFTVPSHSSSLIKKVQSLSLSETSKIICYDKGELTTACKVFWSLKAAGFENIFIMLGGIYLYHDLGFQITNDPAKEVPLEDSGYLPFNNSVMKIDSEDKPKSSYCQKIRADVEICINTPRGQLLEVECLRELLANEGIKWKTGKAVQVCGKYAAVVAAVLIALGEKYVSVLIDEKERKYLSCSKSVIVGDKEVDVARAYSVHQNSLDFSYAIEPTVPKKTTSRKAGNVCGNCLVF